MANFRADSSTMTLLKQEEGFRSRAYWDESQWSIGYGSGTLLNGQRVKEGDTITQSDALILLERLINNEYGATVNRVITSNINRNQWNALTSLCYNIGVGGFSGSTVVRRVNANPNDFDGIADAFRMWKNSNGRVNPVLVSRREREIKVYMNSVSGSFFLP